jgi:hypothetical protein
MAGGRHAWRVRDRASKVGTDNATAFRYSHPGCRVETPATVGVIGRNYANSSLIDLFSGPIKSSDTFKAGVKLADKMKCGDDARLLADEIVSYLRRTAGSAQLPGRFVRGCVAHYGGKISADQCQCLADIARSIYPDVHQQEFSSETYRRLIEANPFVGLQVIGKCQIIDY